MIAVMSVATETRMTVDDFLVWAEAQPGRYELYNGVVYSMAPERAVHAKVKFALQTALAKGIKAAGIPCHMLPDRMTVRVEKFTAHEPDALVYCGQEVPGTAVEILNPVIVVEVLSPSTRYIDASAKLFGYFRLPSVAQYLIVDPERPVIILHTRGTDDTIITRIVKEEHVRLDPPGIDLSLADVIAAQSAAPQS
jgi:Uma2 family endonuclease